MTRKSVLRSVRLDDDVWKAVKAMDRSLNQYLREKLLAPAITISLPPSSSRNSYRPPLLKPSEAKK